ncbi:MAG: hypothetical protein ACREUP_13480 [Burkholderiales bacterium]
MARWVFGTLALLVSLKLAACPLCLGSFQPTAAWQYWDAVPEYVALMKSDLRQQYASRVSILEYLRKSPGGVQVADGILRETRASGAPMQGKQ